ncbi:MAG: amidohydrolase [Cyclobacteriaceae bacterium]|nr:amidohydrolase [Cyclobacteriaceae bacterium]
MKKLVFYILLLVFSGCQNETPQKEVHEDTSEKVLLENYRPESIYKTPQGNLDKTRRIIDMHSHPYPQSIEAINNWVKTMDEKGIEKTVLLTYRTGAEFDSLVSVYKNYSDKFDLWCGFDFTDYDKEGWVEKAIAELERCKKAGAKGVGELGDKGLGFQYSRPSKAPGMHVDDARIQPLLKRCGELNMPINIHVAEPYWMYLPTDSTNDGLMNAEEWKIDLNKEGILNHEELIHTLEEAVKNNPETTFIACHFANTSYDLSILGDLLDKYDNLYSDISARYAETSPIPRYMKQFYSKYQDRLLYGTDMGMDNKMYDITFRILETEDDHFYEIDQFNYHWPLYGIGLDSTILDKVYYANAKKIIK